MTQNLPPPIPSLIPETAPFSEEQRIWLNGFFAGLVSLDGFGVTPLSGEQAAALISGATASKADDDDDGGALWHDQTLPMAERMKLADGKPLRWRMMAAMAQQDCGQCGYDCKNYSGAIVSGKEERLNLCVPGGKETARMLKTLFEEFTNTPPARKPAAVAKSPHQQRRRYAALREIIPLRPLSLSRTRLNGQGSEKETWHLNSIFPTAVLITRWEMHLACSRQTIRNWSTPSSRRSPRPPTSQLAAARCARCLLTVCRYRPRPTCFFNCLPTSPAASEEKRRGPFQPEKIRMGMQKRSMCLPRLRNSPAIRPDPEAFIEALDPLQPRSIRFHPRPKPRPDELL